MTSFTLTSSGIALEDKYIRPGEVGLSSIGAVNGSLYGWSRTTTLWGDSTDGFSSGAIVTRSSPVQVGTTLDWKYVDSEGADNAYALKTDNTLWVWGQNGQGALGIGTTATQYSPVQLGTSKWKFVVGGRANAIAIREDNTLWGWGWNPDGALGLGDTASRSSPVQLATGEWKTAAITSGVSGRIRADGTLWMCGGPAANKGVLGQNNTISRSSPVQVGTLSNWSQVSVGYSYVCALKTDGTLWAWGDNTQGQLGLNDINPRSSPVQVGTDTNWYQVRALQNGSGTEYTLALKTNGTLWAWGYNTDGQLGLGDTVFRSSPVQVGSLSNWSFISDDSAGVLKTDGTLWMWGFSSATFPLGDNNTISRSSPVQIGTETTWKSVSGGRLGIKY